MHSVSLRSRLQQRLPAGLRRALNLCGLQLRVELTQKCAAMLDNAAILGLGHDRDRIEHTYLLECMAAHGADCDFFPAKQFARETRITVVIPKCDRFRLWATTDQQGHLFDRHGYAPGIYELYPQFERSLLGCAHLAFNLPADTAAPIADHGVEHTEAGTDQRQTKCHPTEPLHAAHRSSGHQESTS